MYVTYNITKYAIDKIFFIETLFCRYIRLMQKLDNHVLRVTLSIRQIDIYRNIMETLALVHYQVGDKNNPCVYKCIQPRPVDGRTYFRSGAPL